MIGQDIFDRNLVPADTDYRIYRDYLNISGLDFAFIRNGFTYHTPDDDIQHVESGQIQHMGDNILAVTESILQKDLSDVADRQGGVYFDFFGLRMVVVSKSTLFITWNTILAGAITLVIYKNLGVIRGLLRLLTLLLLCLFSAAFLPLLVTITRSALFWYSVFPLVLVLYALPVCFTAFLITPFLDMLFHPRAPPSLLLRQHLLASCFLSILCGAVMAFYRIGASFLPLCVALSSGTTLFFLSMAASVGWKMEESGLGILLLLTINCLLPFAVFGYIIVPLDAVAGPLVGKMSDTPPLFIELACGLLAYLHCLPALLSLSPFFSLLSRRERRPLLSLIVHLVRLLGIALLLTAGLVSLCRIVPGMKSKAARLVFNPRAPRKVILMEHAQENATFLCVSATDPFGMEDLETWLQTVQPGEAVKPLQSNNWTAILPISTILTGLSVPTAFPNRHYSTVSAQFLSCESTESCVSCMNPT